MTSSKAPSGSQMSAGIEPETGRTSLLDSENDAVSPGTVRPLLLCGGSGTRLWPLSRDTLPKQLLPLHGSETLLQATARRVSGDLFASPLVVSREEFGPAVAVQLAHAEVDPQIILLEPAGRNTAAAIALGVYFELAAQRDSVILALPSDQVIRDRASFEDAVRRGIPSAQRGAIVTFGVRPAWAETGYGYIEVSPSDDPAGAHKVARFTEKPDWKTAKHYLSSGNHYWNSGMLLFRASAMKEQLLLHAPNIAMACEQALSASILDGTFLRLERQSFSSAPAISIDYAILEKSDSVCVIPSEMGWSDIGNWRALWELSDKDGKGNVVTGNVELLDCSNCLIRNETDTKVVLARQNEVVVILTVAGTLVMPLEFAQTGIVRKNGGDVSVGEDTTAL